MRALHLALMQLRASVAAWRSQHSKKQGAEAQSYRAPAEAALTFGSSAAPFSRAAALKRSCAAQPRSERFAADAGADSVSSITCAAQTAVLQAARVGCCCWERRCTPLRAARECQQRASCERGLHAGRAEAAVCWRKACPG